VRQIANASMGAGHTVEVLCQDRPDAPYLEDFPLKIHTTGRGHLGRFGLSLTLWRWIRDHAGRYDCIIMNGIWTFPNLATRIAARKAGTPYAVFTHGGLDPWFRDRYPLKHLKKMLYWPFQYRVLRDAQAVFFTTKTESDLAEESFRPNTWKGVVIPYGIGTPQQGTVDQKEVFLEHVPALRGRSFFLFLGRIHEKKGCDLLMEAYARVAHETDLDLVVAGPDQMELQGTLQAAATRAGIADRVHWPGVLTGDVKWGALRSCAAFVLPSHQENFGIAVVESLAAGRPVLISNQVNIWPEIQADAVGLVDDDTLDGTERLLRGWIAMQPEEQDAMAARTEATFHHRYSIAGAASAIMSAFFADKEENAEAAAGPKASGESKFPEGV
jgi:glycosyltransferase involved in cell wall biosynthesis